MDLRERVASLEQMLVESTAERDEALEYQTATSDEPLDIRPATGASGADRPRATRHSRESDFLRNFRAVRGTETGWCTGQGGC
jgi:hypothetical protein